MKKIIFLLAFFLILINFSSAAPPVTTTISSANIVVDALVYGQLKQNQEFTLHVHAYNSTTGLNLSNSTTSCSFHLYNSSGNHLLRNNNMLWDGKGDWEDKIAPGNFSQLGAYALEVWCLAGTTGGSERIFFEVTATGDILKTHDALFIIVYFSILFGVMAFLLILVNMFKSPGVKIFIMGILSLTILSTLALWASGTEGYLANFVALVQFSNAYYILATIIASGAGIALVVWLVKYAFEMFNKSRGVHIDD